MSCRTRQPLTENQEGTCSVSNMLLLALLISTIMSSLTSASPPNILFIVADDLGWADVQWRDPDMYTPNLNRLREEGVEMTNAYAGPSCTPSRSAFMTGIYPYKMGIQDDGFEGLDNASVPLDKKMLPQTLKEYNYSTHMVGKWHLGFCRREMTPLGRGFDTFYGMYNGATDHYTHTTNSNGYDLTFNESPVWTANGTHSIYLHTRRAINILKSHDQSKPLFIYLAYQALHYPIQVPEYYINTFCANVNISEERKIRCGMAAALDEGIGNVTRNLEKLGYMNNTLIIFSSDNGGPINEGASNWPLRGSKKTIWEGGTKVTSFLYSKTLLKGNRVYNGIAHATDWYPTLQRVAGGNGTIEGIDGLNLWESIATNGASPRQEFIYDLSDITNRSAIRYKNYKLTWNRPGAPDLSGWYNPPPGVEQPPTPKYTSKVYLLFDLATDPTETTDISNRSDVRSVFTYMKNRLYDLRLNMPPCMQPTKVSAGKPENWGGAWTTGWC